MGAEMKQGEIVFVDVEPLLKILPKNFSLDILRRTVALLPQQETEVGLFKKRVSRDPVLAIKILNRWFALYRWGE